MSEPFMGEIKAFSFSWEPKNWARCAGQQLPIFQHQALYSLIGTYYGGDGCQYFHLPDLRGRVPVHIENSCDLGRYGGFEEVPLSVEEMPAHTHDFFACEGGSDSTNFNTGEDFLVTSENPIYGSCEEFIPLNSGSVTKTGRNCFHTNMQPYFVVNFCIALVGLYPPRS